MRLLGGIYVAYICATIGVILGATIASQAENLTNLISIADFQKMVSKYGSVIQSFRVEGMVRAVVPQRNLMALQDGSATALIELPTLGGTVHTGEKVGVEGENCSIVPGRYCAQIGTAPVVDNDGRHIPRLRSGKVFLEKGRQPVHLEWFNGENGSKLQVEWQGLDDQRQKIPDAVLWHESTGTSNGREFEPGLDFAAYNGGEIYFLSDFKNSDPVAKGIATNFDLSYRARPDNTALVFDGYIEIPESGIYTFYVTSDDGALLRVGKPKVSSEVIASSGESAPPEDLNWLKDGSGDQWGSFEGEVNFVSKDKRTLEIDLVGKLGRVPVAVVDSEYLSSSNLIHRQIRVTGICQFLRDSEEKKLARIIVPSSGQVEIIGSQLEGERELSTNDLLTTIAQARRLRPDEVALNIPVKFKGVVIGAWASKLVLCDSTGGISVHFDNLEDWTDQPQIGELLEIKGFAIPGQFVPAIQALQITRLGNAPMPEPVRPTWDELMNGSLDCEYVELQGVLTAVSTNEITLLTRDGSITLDRTEDRPLPRLPIPGESLVGSVVRLRGGFSSEWDSGERQVIRGRFRLVDGLMGVEYPPPLDPFSISTSKVGDLLWYNAHASAIQRIKVEGQVIFSRPGECFALDHNIGFRILTSDAVTLEAGDLVEAVGFPKLSGFAPVLQESKIRKIGHASLPAPIRLSASQLLDRQHDSMLIQVEAMLINNTIRPNSQILELQAGQTRFQARLNIDSNPPVPFAIGSRLQLVAVYAAASADRLGSKSDPFELLLNNPAAVAVIQLPPWWTVQRAFGMVAALGGALGLAVIWVTLLKRKVETRTNQLKKEIEERQLVERQRIMEQERTRVAQDLHDELGAGLTEMSLLGSLAKRVDVPTQEREVYLDQLTESARSLVTGLDEIVWAINPHYDSVGSTATYYSFFAEEFLNLAGIACHLQVVDSLPKTPLDSKIRHGIFLAFKEALNNVVRHSHASEVILKINMTGNQLTISISDNGCGFEHGFSNPGSDGLSGMRQRVQKLGGICDVSSQIGQGTTVEFRLNLPAVIVHSAL
jgi:signal transduction histidine kinase